MTTGHPSLESLADYLAAALPADAEDAVRRHLAGCAACSDTARSLEQVPVVLSEAASVPEAMPEAVWTRIQGALRAEGEPDRPASLVPAAKTDSARARSSHARSLLAAAVAVAVIGAAGATLRQLSSDHSVTSSTGTSASPASGRTQASTEHGSGAAPSLDQPRRTPDDAGAGGTRSSHEQAFARNRSLSPANVSSYATQLSSAAKLGPSALPTIRASSCAQPRSTAGSALVTVRRWKGAPAVVVVNPSARRVSVLDCHTASIVLYTTRY